LENSNKSVAIIPARGGSKRIPYKNIKLFNNYPIIKYSIDAAIKSNRFDDVIVSTDSEQIADIAIKYGASVPFFRSQKNSDDFATTADVLIEVLKDLESNKKFYQNLCCIYPTAPFVTPEKIIKAMDLLHKSQPYAEAVLPVTEFSYPILRSLVINDGNIAMKWPENYNKRSQDFEKFYHDAGQYYCLLVDSLKSQKTLYPKKTIPIILSNFEVQDIDNFDDWKIAELKYRILFNNNEL
jgi:N-acylneuraminate cytidylyltransferase